MDSQHNKEQAEKCVEIAQKAMTDKQWDKVGRLSRSSFLIDYCKHNRL